MHRIYSLTFLLGKCIKEKPQYTALFLSLLVSSCLPSIVWTAGRIRVGRGLQCLRRTLGSGGSLVSMITRRGLSWLSVPVRTIWYVGASGSSLMHPLPSGQVTVNVNGNRSVPCARSFQVPWIVRSSD